MDAATLEIFTGIIFVLTYLAIIFFYKKKTWVIWTGVVLAAGVGAITLQSAFDSINWDVMGIYVGMLFIAQALVSSRVPDYIAIWVVDISKKVWVAMILVCAFTGFLSIVIENVACVLIVAPIIFAIAKKINVSPVPMIIGSAVSSNLQGVATLIGDPPSMLLASYAKMNFNDFFFFDGKPGLFFAVQLGMLASLVVLYLFFRRYSKDVAYSREIEIKSFFPAGLLIGMVVVLAVSSSLENSVKYSAGAICMAFGFFSLVWLFAQYRQNIRGLVNTVAGFDWSTAFFIIAVFILVSSLEKTGVVADIANFMYGVIGNNLAAAFITIVTLSVLFSAFVDNVPYIVAMLPVTGLVAGQAGFYPYVLFFGLLVGASVGGNITPIGASANIVGVGLLKNRGYETTFWDFVKIGLPFTIVSVIASAGFIWLVFG